MLQRSNIHELFGFIERDLASELIDRRRAVYLYLNKLIHIVSVEAEYCNLKKELEANDRPKHYCSRC